MTNGLVEMPAWECDQLLRGQTLGRLCVIANGYPLALPVSYQVAEPVPNHAISVFVRTRPGGLISQSLGLASLEIDHVDAAAGTAWSVIVHGTLGPVHDTTGLPVPRPWLQDGRNEWLALEAHRLSGRRFKKSEAGAFSVDWEVSAS